MNSDDAEKLDRHAKILRSIWMMSKHGPLSSDERRMLMEAIEAIEEVVERETEG